MSEPSARVRRGLPKRLWWAAPLTALSALVANQVARLLLYAFLPLPAEFAPLNAGAIAFFTVLGVMAGGIVYGVLWGHTAAPLGVWRALAGAALLASIVPNVALMASPETVPLPGASALAFGALIPLHLIAGAIAILLLPELCRDH